MRKKQDGRGGAHLKSRHATVEQFNKDGEAFHRFCDACQAAGVKPTYRQARKMFNGRGAALKGVD